MTFPHTNCPMCEAGGLHGSPLRAIDADNARIRAELRDRLDRLDDVEIDRALHWLAQEMPDAVNDALNETEARP